MRPGDYTSIENDRLELSQPIVVPPGYHLAIRDCIMKSHADPPIVVGHKARVIILNCILEGTWPDWWKAHLGEIDGGNNILKSDNGG